MVTIPAKPTRAPIATVVIDAVTAPSTLQVAGGQWSRKVSENSPISAPAPTVSTVRTISRIDTVRSAAFVRGGGGISGIAG